MTSSASNIGGKTSIINLNALSKFVNRANEKNADIIKNNFEGLLSATKTFQKRIDTKTLEEIGNHFLIEAYNAEKTLYDKLGYHDQRSFRYKSIASAVRNNGNTSKRTLQRYGYVIRKYITPEHLQQFYQCEIIALAKYLERCDKRGLCLPTILYPHERRWMNEQFDFIALREIFNYVEIDVCGVKRKIVITNTKRDQWFILRQFAKKSEYVNRFIKRFGGGCLIVSLKDFKTPLELDILINKRWN